MTELLLFFNWPGSTESCNGALSTSSRLHKRYPDPSVTWSENKVQTADAHDMDTYTLTWNMTFHAYDGRVLELIWHSCIVALSRLCTVTCQYICHACLYRVSRHYFWYVFDHSRPPSSCSEEFPPFCVATPSNGALSTSSRLSERYLYLSVTWDENKLQADNVHDTDIFFPGWIMTSHANDGRVWELHIFLIQFLRWNCFYSKKSVTIYFEF